jgi:class 3 adenylate cyclase
VYLDMPEKKQVTYIRDSMKHDEERRRHFFETGQNEEDRFTSNYRVLSDVLNQRQAPRRLEDLGSLLEAARSAGQIEQDRRLESEIDQSRRGAELPASPSMAQRNRKAVADGADPHSEPKRKIKAMGVVAMMSSNASRETQDLVMTQQRHKLKVRDRADRWARAAAPVRQRLTRTASMPPHTTGTMKGLEAENARLRLIAKELTDMKLVVAGKNPRAEEVKMGEKVTALNLQINNQIGLIKGLREKLKVTRSRFDTFLAGRALDAEAEELTMALSGSGFDASPRGGNRPGSRMGTPAAAVGGRPGSRMSAVKSPSDPSNGLHEAPSISLPTGARPVVALSRHSLYADGFVDRGTPPRTAENTMVFCDVQSAAHLWETSHDIMKSQIQIYRALCREAMHRYNGYEVALVGDRFHFAFEGPIGATRFCLDLQVMLVEADWCLELSDNPDTPMELVRGSADKYLWRGLRVSMGVHNGAAAIVDPASGTTYYGGLPVEVASLLELIAVGGEILITAEVNAHVGAYVAGVAANDELPRFQHYQACRTQMRRLIPNRLKDRGHFLERDIGAAEANALMNLKDLRCLLSAEQAFAASGGYPHPPAAGPVTLVCVSPSAMEELQVAGLTLALQVEVRALFCKCAETTARASRGYVSRRFEGHYVLAFHAALDGVMFALHLQTALLAVEWPPDLLLVPQFATVRIKSTLVFNGVRARVGVFNLTGCTTAVDPHHATTQYIHQDAVVARCFVDNAMGGEILCDSDVADVVIKHTDRLQHPTVASALAVSLPTNDAVMTAFHVFPPSLNLRAPFLKRELRLGDEPADDRTEAIGALERQVEALQGSVAEKDRQIQKLERQAAEKVSVIEGIRHDVLGLPFRRIDVAQQVAAMSNVTYYEASSVVLALSFAHSSELMEQWTDELPEAIEMLEEFTNTMLEQYNGTELRRVQSGAVRVLLFSQVHFAVDFWLAIARNSIHLPWPDRLEHSEFAGVVMASDIRPGLHPSMDELVWKGLRPVAGLVRGQPETYFDPVARTAVAAGGCINDAMMLLHGALAGECYLLADLALAVEPTCADRVENMRMEEIPALDVSRIIPEELGQRHTDAAKVSLDGDTSTPGCIVAPLPANRASAVVVHVIMQAIPVLRDAMFVDDVERYHHTIAECIGSFGGAVIFASDTEYLIGFLNCEHGAEFSTHLHVSLVHQAWSPELLRVAECRERLDLNFRGNVTQRGIRAAVGAHLLPDVNITLDLVQGKNVWMHKDIAVPYLLARTAHAGESFVSSDVRDTLNKAPGLKHAVYFEAAGSYQHDEPSAELFYTALPVEFKARIADFLNDDIARLTPTSRRAMDQAETRKSGHAQRHAELLELEQQVLADFSMVVPANIFESVHGKNAALAEKLRPVIHKNYAGQRTAMLVLQMAETASMMSEDLFYTNAETLQRRKVDREELRQQPLMMHIMEHAALCSCRMYDRKAVTAIVMEPEDGDDGDDDGDEARDGGALRSGLSGDYTSMFLGAAGGGGTGIGPENLAQLHIEVERFGTMIEMHGVHAGGPDKNFDLLDDWVSALHRVVCPSLEDGDVTGSQDQASLGQSRSFALQRTASSLAASAAFHNAAKRSNVQKLEEMAKLVLVGGALGGGAIESDRMHQSLVANLSVVLQRLCVDIPEPEEEDAKQYDSDDAIE